MNERNSFDVSVLHVAADVGSALIIRILLENGAEINARDQAGCTPLIDAADKLNDDCIVELLDRGAQINLANKVGNTPLHMTAARGHIRCSTILS